MFGRLTHPYVKDIAGKKPGKTLLVTAGMDGDEYAGIDAAYQLIEKYKGGNFAGRLIIIPIVNIPGFEGGTSWNPFDKKYPKHLYPGKQTGTASERLISWLRMSWIKQADMWLDLHGGAISEELLPFVLAQETDDESINNTLKNIICAIHDKRMLFEYKNPQSWRYAIGKDKVTYLLAESGQSGQRKERDIKRHIAWTDCVMGVLGMILKKKTSRSPTIVYRRMNEYMALHDGLWYQEIIINAVITKGQLLGEILSMDRKVLQRVTAKESGIFLWGKEAMNVKKGDTLIALGYDGTMIR